MTPLPRYTPNPLPNQVNRILAETPDRTDDTRRWHETPAWARGIPLIGPGINSAIPGTDPARLAEEGAFD